MRPFLESDLERMLFRSPNSVHTNWNNRPIERWIARQYIVPSGVIDLLGVMRNYKDKPIPVVVELKNRPLKSADIAQVLRYSADINDILLCLAAGNSLNQIDDAVMVLIGVGVPSNQVLFEAYAANVYIHEFTINQSIEVSGRYSWTSEFRDSISNRRMSASQSKIFDVFFEQGE
jgi:hypothetical protein